MSAASSSSFPRRPHNRPALPRIGYRLGAYPEILEAMLHRLNASVELAKWTHRAPDDPGIALLESGAVVADILTFYQEHYANEAFLRTARWPESIQELVRLTGYRLAPGLGGRATFALEVKGEAPVTVPAGFPLKAELAGDDEPADFLTGAEHTALPAFSRFHLYRPRAGSTPTGEVNQLEITTVGGSADPSVLASFDLKKGDQLMLVPAAPTWLTSGSSVAAQSLPQTVKVARVTHRLGRLMVDLAGRVSVPAGGITAYRVNRVFRHFGHNTPPKVTYQTGSGDSLKTEQRDAHLQRHIKGNCQGTPAHLHTTLPKNILPLDQEVNDLAPGGLVLIEALLKPSASHSAQRVTVAREIRGRRALTMHWGNVSGPSTWIDLGAGQQLVPNAHFPDVTADFREFRLHEVTSPALVVKRVVQPAGGALLTPQDLCFYGPSDAAAALPGRRLFFQAEDGRCDEATVVAVDTAAPPYARMRPVTLDHRPAGFTRGDFDETAPAVTVFGNLVEATQGKAEREVPLGNGDARQVFQTFKLPKAPLTYLLDPASSPPHVPELTLLVNRREWTRVETLFGAGPRDEVYIVREDSEGESYVQFGDGEQGARLPSGIQNVVAIYRTGNGALGPAKPGSPPSAGARLDRLEKLTLAGEAVGGAPAEPAEKARRAAPGRLQGLGRLVSLRDYETEALLLPGVVAAAASWQVIEGVPSLQLAVLLEQAQQSDAQFAALETALRAADRARGPHRHPLRVIQCELRYVYLAVTYAHEPGLITADVETDLRAALGLVGDEVHAFSGLFGLRRRRLGEKEYATRIEGRLQNVAGIRWCRVQHCGLLAPADDPLTLSLPAAPARHAQLRCAGTELLQLHPQHLTLTPTAP